MMKSKIKKVTVKKIKYNVRVEEEVCFFVVIFHCESF